MSLAMGIADLLGLWRPRGGSVLGTLGSSLSPLVALSQRPSNPGSGVLEIGDQPARCGVVRLQCGNGDGASRSRMNPPTRRPPGGAVGGAEGRAAPSPLLVRDDAPVQGSVNERADPVLR